MTRCDWFRQTLSAAFVLLLWLPGSIACGSEIYPSLYKTDSLLETVLRGVALVANDRFAEGESLFSAMAESYPASPVGPVFLAGSIHAQMLDRESAERTPEFNNWLEEGRRRARQWRDSDPESAEPEFLLGVLEGYDAVWHARWGGWLAALKRGLRSKSRFDAALKKDSTLIDALIGPGNYDYWKAVKTDFVNWLPLIPDNRDKGLSTLHRVATEGLVSKTAARASLVSALINEERFLEALSHADTLAADAPTGKAATWMRARAFFGMYRWDEALALYQELAERIALEGEGNNFNQIECGYYISLCHFEAGRYKDAATACHQALSLPADDDVRKRQNPKLRELRDMQKRLKKLLADPGL